jgi:hypothetical protein
MSKASDKLAELRQRGDKKKFIEPVFQNENSDFSIQRWYDKIRNDPTVATIEQAALYYDEAVKDGTYYVVPTGNLQTLTEQHPGITFFYQGILVDVQQSRRWLEGRIERLEAQRYNYYMYDDAAKAEYGTLKTTDATKLAKGDPLVVEMSDCARLLAFHEHNLARLMEAFDNIKYVLNNIVVIRKEKLEEVWVDPTSESTTN